VLDSIDAIQFVDSSPEALRKRLGHGNIYPPDRVPEALSTEFLPARLAALREVGLGLVALSVPSPGASRQRNPQDVLVVIVRPEQAESLVLRGVRLARRRGAHCYVLALSQPGQPSLALSDQAIEAAAAAGASMLVRDSRDAVGAITTAVQETSARHLVLAVPAAGLLERWRGTLLERLAGQLPGVHLHVLMAPSAAQSNGEPGADGQAAAAEPHAERRGAIRVYLGYAPGCGTTTAMLEEALRRKSRGTDVVVGAVATHDREHVLAELEGLELIGDGGILDTDAVLARKPEVVCVDDLTGGTATAERRFAAARRLTGAGITVVGTVQLGRLGSTGGASAGAGAAASGAERLPDRSGALLDVRALLALADEIELVDVPPTILIDRVKRGEIVPAGQIDEALATTYQPQGLQAERERAFALVAEHGERQLAGYASDSQAPLHEPRPSILACVAPWPGMEWLLRRSAALAAQVDGIFGAAAVRLGQPGGDEDRLLATFAALTAQLGGQLAVLTGPGPAVELAEYARRHRVTEMVLTRAEPKAAGRYPLLRDLARVARDVEVHVLPADPAG
jgi:K+-sensing histidine kinase KdpD